MAYPQSRSGIMDIAPYIGGEAKAEGLQRLIRLASNEGAYGPPPKAVEALRAALSTLHRYPDGSYQLKSAVATSPPACNPASQSLKKPSTISRRFRAEDTLR